MHLDSTNSLSRRWVILGGTIVLFQPLLTKSNWVLKMFGEIDPYVYIAFVHLILAIPFSIFGLGKR